MKDMFITFRATQKENEALTKLAKKANLTKSDFIRHSIFNKEIVVINGVKELRKEMKAIGNNLNQLTTRSNMGHFQVVNLAETTEKLGEINDRLIEITSPKTEFIEEVIEAKEPEKPTGFMSLFKKA